MHLSLVFIAILAALARASSEASGSSSHLVRRDQEPDFRGILIMKDSNTYTHGHLPIYNAQGVEEYGFSKSYRPPAFSTSVLTRGAYPYITLTSNDDTCASETYYSEADFPGGSHLSYEIDPRGMKSDKWSFSFVTGVGEQISFHYKRNVLNKGGKVYEKRKNRPKRFVARLQEQTRWEPWLQPGKRGTPTFTLTYDLSTGLDAQLATLMALVLDRVATCGL